jgi:hypothetical protein
MSDHFIYRLNEAEDGWVVVFDLMDIIDPLVDMFTDMIVYDGCIIAGCYVYNYWYSATGDDGEWTHCTLDNSIAWHFCIAPPFTGTKDILLASFANQLRSTIDATNAAVPGWSDPQYYIGEDTSYITSIMILNGMPFIGKEDGLWYLRVDSDDEIMPQQMLPEFRTQRSLLNFAQNISWQASLYFSLLNDLAELTSQYEFGYVGPWGLFPELGLIGEIVGLANDAKNIYAIVRNTTTSSPTVYYQIYAGREHDDEVYGLRWEWTPIAFLDTGFALAAMVSQRSAESRKLWFGYEAIGLCANITHLILSDHPLSETDYVFSPQGYLITSWFDANYEIWEKMFYKLWIKSSQCEDGVSIKVYYQKDEDTEWSDVIATVEDNGVQEFSLPPLYCKRIRLKFELNTNNSSKTPILEQFILRGYVQPETISTIDFIVLLESTNMRKVSSDLAFLRSGRKSDEPIKLTDLRFKTTRYVIFLPGSPTEVELIHEPSKQPSYGARLRVQELSWEPMVEASSGDTIQP